MPCGSTQPDRAIVCTAVDLMDGANPSALPIRKQGLCPSAIQIRNHCASNGVVSGLPRSSQTIRRAPFGIAVSILSASRASTRAVVRLLRSSGVNSTTSIRASGGMRLVYSATPSATHEGILCPSATILIFTNGDTTRKNTS